MKLSVAGKINFFRQIVSRHLMSELVCLETDCTKLRTFMQLKRDGSHYGKINYEGKCVEAEG